MVFRKFGWGTAAAITPLLMLLTGGVFFGLSIGGLYPGATAIATAGVLTVSYTHLTLPTICSV